jgi:beta-glucosidase
VLVLLLLCAPRQAGATYMNQPRPVRERVEELLNQMTLPEKVGQMDQILITHVTERATSPACPSCFGDADPTAMQTVLIDNFAGSLLAGGTDMPHDTSHAGGLGNTGRDWAATYNAIQSFAIQRSRLHIPVLFGVDAVHGFSHPFDAPLFPHQIGMGATWDTSLAETAGMTTANALRATGWVLNFAPVQDVFRDNRWGRAYETWSEEPVLAGALGAANVRALQAQPASNGLQVAATLKHLAGNSQSINGHDRVAGLLPIRYLQDVFLPSYKSGIDAGARLIMVSSSSINGVPATASHFLQTDLVRQRLGFEGVIISDFKDVQALNTAYHVAPTSAAAIARAVNAGLDLAMWVDDPDQWQAGILAAVANGVVSEQRINESVRRILTLKFELGLFDEPCVADPGLPCVDPDAAETAVSAGREATLQAARESVVLLKNDHNVLPLSTSVRVLLTGPTADSMVDQLGGWSVSWQGVSTSGHGCCEGPPGQIPPGTTLRQGMHALDADLVYAPVSQSISSAEQDAAVAAAVGSDAVVVAVGEQAYAEGIGDDPAPALRPDQKALVAALEATGKPVILVVIAGRPLGLGASNAQNSPAILVGFQGSTETGQALAEVLFGVVNPSGKLPVTWPTDADTRVAYGSSGDFNDAAASPLGDQPKLFDQPPSTAAGAGSGYNPLFSLGYGLSYTTYQATGLAVGGPGADRIVTASFSVANTGALTGAQVVPVFVHQLTSETVAPPHRLVGFARVTLDSGESRQVQVAFPVAVLAVTPGDIDSTATPRVSPGPYVLEVPNQVMSNNLFPPNGALTAVFSVS